MATPLRPYPDTPPNRLPWPPLITVTAIVAGVLLQTLVPLPWPPGVTRDILQLVGVIMVLGGVTLMVLAIRELRRHGTTIMPDRSASQIVTSGVFGVSRNPIYLGHVVVALGLAMALGNAWLLLAAVAIGFLLTHLAILREEHHLERLSPRSWRDYKRRVRRWF